MAIPIDQPAPIDVDWEALGFPAAPTLTWEVIYPSKASRWLERNVNRRVRGRPLDRYTDDVASGRWEITGEAIKFDWNGDLRDGQHRLMAVVRANKPIISLVIRGLPPTSQEAMDGGATRTLGNQLQLKGVPQASRVAGAVAEISRWIEGSWRSNVYTGTPSVPKGLELHERFPDLLDYVRMTESRVKQIGIRGIAVSAWTVFAYITDRVDAEVSEVFHNRVADGVGLQEHDPTYQLRRLWTNWSSRTTGEPPAPHIYRATLIKAWNNHYDGRPSRAVHYKPGANEVYPVPLGVERVPWITVPEWRS